jgi:protein involved in polysaccharide export with SLBB domain
MTLLEALTIAGGTARAPSAVSTVDLADLRHSFVMRQGRVLPVNFVSLLQEGDMSQNIYLQPDDFVFIPSSLSQEVYVLGSVRSPSTVPFSDPMTLISAIAGANGPADEAYLGHVAIVRGSLSQPQLIEVNYNAVLRGKAPNIALEPGDIVYVPLSPYRYLTEYAQLIVNSPVPGPPTWAPAPSSAAAAPSASPCPWRLRSTDAPAAGRETVVEVDDLVIRSLQQRNLSKHHLTLTLKRMVPGV